MFNMYEQLSLVVVTVRTIARFCFVVVTFVNVVSVIQL